MSEDVQKRQYPVFLGNSVLSSGVVGERERISVFAMLSIGQLN